ncbi:MAG TPA: hypothetical protein ENI87_09115 [bacterium]|nr:hypothetical protein [bacterium]
MYELLWTILGVTAALAATWAYRRFATCSEQPEPPATKIETVAPPESREMALALADELASLVSAVEGRAHHLIESAPTRKLLPSAAEAMLSSLARLRHLHSKLVTFGRARPAETGTTDVCERIAELREDLQQMQLGIELRWDPPPELPRIDVGPSVVRDAILFVCAGLLRAERGATRLTFSAERSFTGERPTVKVEMTLEHIAVQARAADDAPAERAFALDLEAARHLLASHGGELELSHLPGKSVSAVIRLPMAVPVDRSDGASAEAQPSPPDPRMPDGPPTPASDSYGGALVLESDPTLRAVLARELKASGRAVFACADGAAADSFLQATPERFELLIVDDPQALDEHSPLGHTLRARAPGLKICLLTPPPSVQPDGCGELHCLPKPFGVHELRRTLASILAVG